jgi:glycyl-tRNA synthetase beta chain
LLTAYRRAANILRIEDRKDGPHNSEPDAGRLHAPEEISLAHALRATDEAVAPLLEQENFAVAMAAMARLRAPLDAFFDKVTVNAPEPDLRRNRLRLLHTLRSTMDRIADFAKIEG